MSYNSEKYLGQFEIECIDSLNNLQFFLLLLHSIIHCDEKVAENLGHSADDSCDFFEVCVDGICKRFPGEFFSEDFSLMLNAPFHAVHAASS